MKRIAFARINQETNALSPVLTTLRDFETCHYLEGDALLRACGPGCEEIPDFFRRAELAGFVRACRARRVDVEPVPILSAWAVASGPLSRETFDALLTRLTGRLRAAGRVDAVYMCLHGAMGVVGVRDPEKEILDAVRSVVGGAPVAVTYDLHANLTKERVERADVLQSYQTNPHRDHARVGKRAGEMLLGMLEGTLRPAVAWRSLPMVLGGGNTLDFLPPMLPVFLRMKWMERARGAVAASVNMCHPWNDHPALGWSTSIVTNGDPDLAERLADELAELCWQRRHDLPPRFASASEAVARAKRARLARRMGVVMMADASDVVTAGAPGESTALLRALLEEGRALRAYFAMRDPAAVEELWSRPHGTKLEVALGGRLDPARGEPFVVRGEITRKVSRPGLERMIVLAVHEARVVVTEGPALAIRPSFYRDVGLDPWRADVIVVKNFFPFLLYFAPMNRKTIFVRTSGVTDFDAARELTFDGPVHPFDAVADWREADRRRRGA
jgi:microcystin degradation protein MlrC